MKLWKIIVLALSLKMGNAYQIFMITKTLALAGPSSFLRPVTYTYNYVGLNMQTWERSNLHAKCLSFEWQLADASATGKNET